jgi:hypothetical protein
LKANVSHCLSGGCDASTFCALLFKAHSRRELLANATIAASSVAAHSARRSLHCEILVPSMSALGQSRQIGTLPPLTGCPLRSKSGQANACLGMSIQCHTGAPKLRSRTTSACCGPSWGRHGPPVWLEHHPGFTYCFFHSSALMGSSEMP